MTSIALFSQIFNSARETGLTSAPNPCLGVKKNAEQGRDVYVEDELYTCLYEKADQPTRDAMDLAYPRDNAPKIPFDTTSALFVTTTSK